MSHHLRAIPLLVSTHGWRDVEIEPVDEPLVRVADIGPRVVDDPRYHRIGLPGALSEGWVRVQAGRTMDRKGNPLTIKLTGPVEAWYEDLGEDAPVAK